MSVGETLPAAVLKPIVVVGKSCIDVAFTIKSIIIDGVAFPLLSSINFIAFM